MITTLPETNSSPLKMGHPKRKFIFQPLMSFREGITISMSHNLRYVILIVEVGSISIKFSEAELES